MASTGDLDTPLKLAHGASERLVVVYSPKGERIVLSAAVALLSARDLARAGRAAARHAREGTNVVPVQFNPLRRLPQRRLQKAGRVSRSQPLRWLVALMLLPVGVALGSAAATFLYLVAFGAKLTLGFGLLLPLLGILVALPLSWLIAPMAMSREERACRAPPGSRPQLVASNGVVAR